MCSKYMPMNATTKTRNDQCHRRGSAQVAEEEIQDDKNKGCSDEKIMFNRAERHIQKVLPVVERHDLHALAMRRC